MDVSCVESVVIRDPIFVKVNKHEGIYYRVPPSLRGACFHLPTQKDHPDTQNQRIRPYFLGQKCRSRYSASIGPVHVPKLGLRSPTKPEGGGEDDTTTRRQRRHDETHFTFYFTPIYFTPDGRLRHPPTRAPHARGNAVSRSGHYPL